MRKKQENSAFERQQQEIDRLKILSLVIKPALRGMANSRQKRLDKMEILEKPKENLNHPSNSKKYAPQVALLLKYI